eukprot:jgi/Bigna1/139269/aug1.49_g13977
MSFEVLPTIKILDPLPAHPPPWLRPSQATHGRSLRRLLTIFITLLVVGVEVMKKKKKGWDGSCKGGGTPERSASYSSSTSAAGSVRREYETHGVKDFYANFGGKYVNPHDAAIQRVLNIAMKKWVTATASGRKAGDDVDSKCTGGGGGGGAKVVLGKITSVLDLACGSGEATIALQKYLGKAKCNFTATDPYTFKAYAQRTGMEAEKYSFKDIANGCYSEKRQGHIPSTLDGT